MSSGTSATGIRTLVGVLAEPTRWPGNTVPRAAGTMAGNLVMWLKWWVAGLLRPEVTFYATRFDLLDAAAQRVGGHGPWLEFGVFKGESLRFLSQRCPAQIYGFDSFEGLPVHWLPGYPVGTFSTGGVAPAVGPNVTIVKGTFEETLPQFTKDLGSTVVPFVHVDCDVYPSALFVLRTLRRNVGPGTIIVFDDFATVLPDDEYRAFRQMLRDTQLGFEYIGCAPAGSVAVAIVS